MCFCFSTTIWYGKRYTGSPWSVYSWHLIHDSKKQMNKYIYYKCIHCSTESVLSIYTLHTYIHTNNIRRPLQGVVAEWMVLLLLPWRYCAEIIRYGPSSVLKQLESCCPWMLPVSHGLLLLLANIDRAASCSNSWATPWFFCSVD